LHRGSGQAVVHVNSRDVYLGVHGTPESKAKYQDIVRRHMADRAKVEMEQSTNWHTDITLAELAANYLQHVRAYYVKDGKPTSQQAGIKAVIDIALEKYAYLEAVKFGPLALRECRDEFVRRGFVRTEINRRIQLIRRLFKWAVAHELIPAEVLVGLQAVSGLRRGRTSAPERRRIKPVPKAFLDAVVLHVSPQIATMCRLQLLTGMRPGEVVVMRTIDINTSGDIWEYHPEHHTLEHRDIERIIMIGPKAQEVLKPWLKAEVQAYLFAPKEAVEATWAAHSECWEERRKTSPDAKSKTETAKSIWRAAGTALARRRKSRRPPGDRYTVVSYRRAIHRACDVVRIDRWSPNRLRHTAATTVRRELGIEAARALLGRSDADTTTIYAERDQELARKAMERLG
jgi:integrase